MGNKTPIFYGYWIIAVTFIVIFISSGIGLYSFGLFVKPLQEAFGWSRGEIMTANTISTIVRGVGGVIAGKLIEKYGPKKVIVLGSVIVGLSLALVGTMNSLWQFNIYYGITGIGFSGMGFIPVISLLFRWFRKRRGLAVGITGIGTGVGSFILAPLIGGYIIPGMGWRAAFFVLSLLPFVFVIPLVLLVIKTGPEEMGLQPDGVESIPLGSPERNKKPTVEDGLSLRLALKTTSFWLIAIPGAMFGFAIMGIIQNQVAHLTDIGFSTALAATVVGIVGIGNSAGKLGFGFVCDRMEAKYARAIVIAIQIVAVVVLMTLKLKSSIVTVWLYATVMGISLGGWLPTMSVLVGSSFGMAAFGTIFGINSMINMFGSSAGPLFAGYMFDTHGAYTIAFNTFLILYMIALVSTLFIPRLRLSTERQTR